MQQHRSDPKIILEVDHITTEIAGREIHKDLSLSIKRGEIVAIIGPSGQGKTTLLRTVLMLLRPNSGHIRVCGIDVTACTDAEAKWVREHWGVMFQSGALFSSLTVLENVMFPIREDRTGLSEALIEEIALFKIALVGLGPDAVNKFPAELSGGMKKRAAMARALALDPTLVFLDEPTAGLDPKSADDFDELMLRLNKDLGLTLVIITHDLDTLWRVPDRVLFIGEGKTLSDCSMSELVTLPHPLIQEYLSGPRIQQRRDLESQLHGH